MSRGVRSQVFGDDLGAGVALLVEIPCSRHAPDMKPHSLHFHVQLIGDLLVGAAVHYQLNHPLLLRGQVLGHGFSGGSRAAMRAAMLSNRRTS